MRKFRLGSHVGSTAAVLIPLALAASSCSQGEAKRVVAPVSRPAPPSEPMAQIADMRWVWDPEALNGAVRAAARNPLVQRALVDAPVSGLVPRPDLAIRAVGMDTDSVPAGFTVLPYSVGGDPTRAAFVSVVHAFGREGVEFAEMIAGRDPRPDEIGFERATWGDQIVWIRTGDSYELAPRGGNLAPVKRNWGKFFTCLADRMPAGCAAGAAIAREAAPGVPHAAAVGCALGAAAGGASCAADYLGK